MAAITKDQVKHVANLARLAITEEEAEYYTGKLATIIEFAEQLNEVDTAGVEPTTHPVPLVNVFREDKPVKGLDRDLMLKNVPEHEDGMVKVPSILG
ncbi:Asp-tRNA(Asn)/Glu-tRNA(Gln) amidotransferase subunit GatC [Bhargavaea beijingensis]|uniref:Aspartyl/glutamyl-tRNA(Asn/Gln) amidotransferase subunit C n=1 Tax=Bhargavaea beijingensis TaxID=426756 RepID=A0A1G7B4G9_9BACL|nr:Asp-tRNA(Asn)/Glu-tRNA(Gln) amidotransferase subunit GatC [Bhargavaea beijingensis]MCW1928347.1 Asp-tRNA(Asn)/Glu-tRNA(Gln) amidotransferase subunit GatC [Bhargavaea beijingensis]RSK32592.1 Asp-tRNA(Asn)/Glu-tRNA(Gln) amidotransferase subunit GatC [Bhargavaea beijingensis]SDE21989.1 aspartyl/glutamyl-tRNA(Asn/Gln) amidotransferase subunit C [Bhargavaea beijingensis]